MKNIFAQDVTVETIEHIEQLTPETIPLWGKMNVSQMLAHLNVMYEMVYEDYHKKANPILGFIMKLFVKNAVVNEKPYPKNSATAPAFRITSEKDFELEKIRLIEYIKKTQALGRSQFDGKESLSFGPLTAQEWNNLFYKHLNHHLSQFGV
ncbi:MAG: DUF1569 domain-containing protein [Bacteroidetes bacterium]|nr:DUF1569 domain-containing protein [Bacteroidota bacterium]NCQ10986.1 DUF1569 domain-containing protein [Bacteroidota bacterium]